MVFDSSCWATDTGNGIGGVRADQLMYTNGENSVYRRPKIDFFNTNSLNMNPVVCGENRTNNVVSHLSSNGYYGYAHVTRSNEHEVIDNATAVDGSMIVSDNQNEQQHNQEPIYKQQQQRQQYTQQQIIGAMESRKRDRCQTQVNEYSTQAKRFRCTIDDTAEGT